MNEQEIRSCPDSLWFEGYIGLDGRVTPTRLPKKFSVELWESLDLMLDDEPKVEIDSDMECGFFIFKLEAESGYEYPHEHEIGLSISDFVEISPIVNK